MSCNTLLFSVWIIACTSLCTGLSPTFVWSSEKSVSVPKVSYEEVQGTEVVLSTVLAASGSKPESSSYIDPASKQPEYIVAYLGKHADSGFFRQTGSPAGPLQTVLESAESWLMFQYTNYAEADSAAAVYEGLGEAGVDMKTVGCAKSTESLSAVDATKLYMGTEQGPRVLVVCGDAADAASEVAEVLSLNKVLADSEHSYLMVYATEASQTRTVGRTLKEDNGKDLTCGPLCKSQVGWLQGILAAGVLLIALISGLSCTYLLDGPTKFEVPKDASTTAS